MSLVLDGAEPIVVMAPMTAAAAAASVGGFQFGRSGLEPDWGWLGGGGWEAVLLVHSLHLGWRSNYDQEDRQEY